MSKTARTDGQWQVDCDLNGVPICIGQPLSLPRYDLPTLDEVRVQCAPLVSAIKYEWRTDHVEDPLPMVSEIGSPEAFAASDDPDCRQGGKACEGCGQRGWHKLSCSQRTDRAPQYPATRDAGGVVTVCQHPCRCGPDGCSVSGCTGKQ